MSNGDVENSRDMQSTDKVDKIKQNPETPVNETDTLSLIKSLSEEISKKGLQNLKAISEQDDKAGKMAKEHLASLIDTIRGKASDTSEAGAEKGEEGSDVNKEVDSDTDKDENTNTDTDVTSKVDTDTEKDDGTEEGGEVEKNEDKEEDDDEKIKLSDRLSKVFESAKGEDWDEEKGWLSNFGNIKFGEFFSKLPAALGVFWNSLGDLFSKKKKKKESGDEELNEEGEQLASAPLNAEDIRLIGASLMVNPGKNLKIKEKTIPEGGNEIYIKGGRPTKEMYENMKAEVEGGKFENVRAVAILAGGNDIHPRSASHVTDYLQKMIELFRGVNPNMKFVFVGLPPVSGYFRTSKDDSGKTVREYIWDGGEENKKAKEINAWIHKMAADDPNIAEVNLYDKLENPDKPGWIKDEYNGDGLHLNTTGYKYLQMQLTSAFESFTVNEEG